MRVVGSRCRTTEGALVSHFLRVTALLSLVVQVPAGAADLVAHWPLAQDSRETIRGLAATAHGDLDFTVVAGRPAADFNGSNAFLEVADDPALSLGSGDFSISLWMHA